MTGEGAGPATFVVVGAGVFGASTALELAKAGHRVVVLERSEDGYHAPDAASNDINKIIRPDYSAARPPRHLGVASLARRAISAWRRSPVLAPFYHEVGVLFHTGTSADGPAARAYVEEAVAKAREPSHEDVPHLGKMLPSPAYLVEQSNPDAVRECFPSVLRGRVGKLADDIENGTTHAYFNSRAGWGEADHATRAILDEAKRLGSVHVVPKACVTELIFAAVSSDRDGKQRIIGVRTSDGREFCSGDGAGTNGEHGAVILCAGAWAKRLLTQLLGQKRAPRASIPTWPTAQCVVAIRLNEEQRKAFKGTPVILDFATGFYLFEPDSDGIMKIAIHSSGYQYPLPSSSPAPPKSFPTFGDSSRPAADSGSDALTAATGKEANIPADKTATMMAALKHAYPELATAPIVYTRVCFYSESHDENWIIDYVPGVEGLVVASGDSGHAFKFLPTLGSHVCGRLGLGSVPSLKADEARVWSFAHHAALHDAVAQSPRESMQFKARL